MLGFAAIGFLAMGLWALGLAWSRKRRRDLWLALWCAGMAVAASWLARGGTLPVQRVVLIVTASDLKAPEKGAPRVQELIAKSQEYNDRWSEVAWVAFGPVAGGSLRWVDPANPRPDELSAPSQILALPRESAKVDFVERFAVRTLAAHASSRWRTSRATVILVLDDSSPWKQPVAKDTEKAAAAPGTDIIVWDRRTRPVEGALHLGLPDGLSRNRRYDRGGTLKLDLPAGATLNGAVKLKRGDAEVDDSRNTINLTALAQEQQAVYFGVRNANPANPPPPGRQPHFLYLSAQVPIQRAGVAAAQDLHAGGFVRETSAPVAVQRVPMTDRGYWSRLRWMEQLTSAQLRDFGGFSSAFFDWNDGRPGRPDIPRLNHLSQRLVSLSAPQFAGLIMENPSLAQVAEQSAAVKAGLALLVIDPKEEALPSSDPKLAWLPGWPLSEGGKSPVRHTDARLYLLKDGSRPGRLKGLAPTGMITPAEFQTFFFQALEEKLGPRWLNSKMLSESSPVQNPPRIVTFPTTGTPADKPSAADVPLFVPGPLEIIPRWHHVPVSTATTPPQEGETKLIATPTRDRDTEAAHIGLRLWLLKADSGTRKAESKLPLIDTREQYANTHIVLFVADVAQPNTFDLDPDDPECKEILATYEIEGAVRTTINTATELKEFSDAGVQVQLIALDAGLSSRRTTLDGQLKPSEITFEGPDGLWRKNIPPSAMTARSAATEADAALNRVQLQNFRLQIQQYGRVIDQRVETGIRAPWQYSRLAAKPESTYAVVNEPDGTPSPIAISSRYGLGQLVVLGYSPWAMDMWVSDSFGDQLVRTLEANATGTYPGSDKTIARYNRGRAAGEPAGVPTGAQSGWGVQRILDFCDLTVQGSQPGQLLEPRRVEYLPETGELLLHAGLTLGAGFAYPKALEMKLNDDVVKPLSPVRLRSEDHEVSYSLGQVEELRGKLGVIREKATPAPSMTPFPVATPAPGTLPTAPAPPTTAAILASIDFSGLPPREEMTLAKAAADWASISGATFVPINATNWPRAEMGITAWVVVLILTLCLAFLLIYRWSTIWQTLEALFQRRNGDAGPSPQPLPVDMEAALAEFGFNPGKSAPIRTPGEPVGWRLLEPSDPLVLARIADLVPYTDIGEEMQLPYLRPRVKLRKSLRAYQAEVWIDLHLRLQLTPGSKVETKAHYLRVLLLLIASNTWSQGGTVRVRSLQDARQEFGPASQGSMFELQEWHENALKATIAAIEPDPRLPSTLEEGTRLYILSDFALLAEFNGLLQEAANGGVQAMRLVRVTDQSDLQAGGLHASLPGLTLYDRSEWDGVALRQESLHALQLLRSALDGLLNARLVELNTDYLFEDMLQKLEREGLFDE